VSVSRPLADTTDRRSVPGDPAPRRWVEHTWQRHPPRREDLELAELPDTLAPRASGQAERREPLIVLRTAIQADLTPRQRDAGVPIMDQYVKIELPNTTRHRCGHYLTDGATPTAPDSRGAQP
jgi:hypothetical protein